MLRLRGRRTWQRAGRGRRRLGRGGRGARGVRWAASGRRGPGCPARGQRRGPSGVRRRGGRAGRGARGGRGRGQGGGVGPLHVSLCLSLCSLQNARVRLRRDGESGERERHLADRGRVSPSSPRPRSELQPAPLHRTDEHSRLTRTLTSTLVPLSGAHSHSFPRFPTSAPSCPRRSSAAPSPSTLAHPHRARE